jgi:hypothetical protein
MNNSLRDKPRQGVVAITLNLSRQGAVGFIPVSHWLRKERRTSIGGALVSGGLAPSRQAILKVISLPKSLSSHMSEFLALHS